MNLVLRALVADAMAAAYFDKRLQQLLARGTRATQCLAGLARVCGDREQEMLGREVLVLQLAHLALGGAQHLDQLARAGGGLRRGAADRRQRVERRPKSLPDRCG